MKTLSVALMLLGFTSTAFAEDRFVDIRQAWVTCAACHGAKGEGGIGPQLAGQTADDIISKLMAYKKGEMVGPRSAMMWPTAQSLTDGQIGTIGVFVQEEFPDQ
jgi:cytochrome c